MWERRCGGGREEELGFELGRGKPGGDDDAGVCHRGSRPGQPTRNSSGLSRTMTTTDGHLLLALAKWHRRPHRSLLLPAALTLPSRPGAVAMAAPPPAAAAALGGAHSVFVYGSLMADEVVSAILRRVPPSSPALLPNYHRFNIKDRIYPAILPVQSKEVAGKVIMGVTDAELHVLDAFEDVEYVRRRVDVSLTDSSETMLADTYVWSDAEDPNLYGEWDFEEWKKLHKKDFLKMTLGFMHELEQPESKTRVETYQSFMHEVEQPESNTQVES